MGLASAIGNVKNIVKWEPSRLHTGAIIVLIQLFMWFSADWLFGDSATMWKDIMGLYMVGTLSALVIVGVRPPTVEAKGIRGAVGSGTMFLLAFVIVGILTAIPGLLSYITSASFMGGLYQASFTGVTAYAMTTLFVIAYSEELMFRVAFPVIDPLKIAGIPILTTGVAFGLFHLAIWHTQPLAVVFLMFFGTAMWLIKNRLGFMGAVGAHSAWNLRVMGALTKFLGF